MRQLAFIAAALLIALGSVGVLAQTTTPEPPNTPEIELQVVQDGRGREWTVDPFDVFECFILERTTALPQSVESFALETSLDMQCFIRVHDQMTPIDPFPTDDIGVTVPVAVGHQAIVSKPQVAAPGGSGDE